MNTAWFQFLSNFASYPFARLKLNPSRPTSHILFIYLIIISNLYMFVSYCTVHVDRIGHFWCSHFHSLSVLNFTSTYLFFFCHSATDSGSETWLFSIQHLRGHNRLKTFTIANQILPNLPGCRSAGEKTLRRRLRKPGQ